MRKIMSLVIVAVIFVSASPCLAGAPRQIGGFVLGSEIYSVMDKVKMETVLPIRWARYMREVEIKKQEGFKSGLISYATCANPGTILRIKLKYAKSGKRFYDQLLKRLESKYGEPDQWLGDPFHVVMAWKWSFVEKDGRTVSLTLQHNTKDSTQKMGNSIKLNLTSAMEMERQCYIEKHPDDDEPVIKTGKISDEEWTRFLPE